MKRMTLALITLILAGLFIVPNAFADSGTLQTANTLYENGRYAEAIQAYEQLTNQGIDDPDLYYNLGNAYYQTGELGQAILNYRRAEQLAPRDGDIQHNLALARQQVTDQFNHTPDNIVDIYLVDVQEWLSLNETAVIALALWTMLCLVILAIRKLDDGRGRMTLKYSLVPLTLVLVLAVFTLGSRMKIANDTPDAVIVANVSDVFAGPGQQYGSDYQLHDGAEVNLYQSRGDWAQIGVPGTAARGWVKATAVAEIN